MGVDQPSSQKASLPQFVANPQKISYMSEIQGPNIRVNHQLEELGQAITSAGMAMARTRQANQDRDREIQLAKLKADTIIQDNQQYADYQANYKGNPDDYSAGYSKIAAERNQNMVNSIQDKKLRDAYSLFLEGYRPDIELRNLQGQQNQYLTDFNTNFNAAKQAQDDLINVNPTLDTLDEAMQSLNNIYSGTIEGKPLGPKAVEAVKNDLQNYKGSLVESMITAQARSDVDTAFESLNNPHINQYLTLEQQEQLQGKMYAILDKQKSAEQKAAKEEFALWFPSYTKAVLEGQPSDQLAKRLPYFQQTGIMSQEDAVKLQVLNEQKDRYASILNNLPNLDAATQDQVVRSLDPANTQGAADETYATRQAIYKQFVDVVAQQRRDAESHPLDAAAKISKSNDPEALRQIAVAQAKMQGKDLNAIKVMNDDQVAPYLAEMHNALTTGNFDKVVSFYNDKLLGEFGVDGAHPWRQVAPNVSYVDLALNQLMAQTKDPMDRKLISGMMLLNDGSPVTQANNFILRAAFLKDSEKKERLASLGVKESDIMDKMRQNAVYRNYFNPANPGPRLSNLLASQRALLTDAIVLQATATGASPVGGFEIPFTGVKVGQQSPLDHAIESVLADAMPYKALDLSKTHINMNALEGQISTAAHRLLDPTTRDQQLKDIAGKPGRALFPDINVVSNNVIMPNKYEGRLDSNDIRDFITYKLNDKQYIFDNVFFNGARPAPVNNREFARNMYMKVTGPVEGGLTPKSLDGSTTMFGIRYANNAGRLKAIAGITSEADIKNLTKDQAEQIAYEGYYVPSGAARAKDPRMGAFIFDTYFHSPAGMAYVRRNVPNFDELLNLEPKAENQAAIAKGIQAMADARIQYLQTDKNWSKFGEGWQNRIKNVRVNAEKMFNSMAGAQVPAQLGKGQQALLDEAAARVRGNLTINSTEDLNGIRLGTRMQDRDGILLQRDGKPLQFTYDEIAEWKRNMDYAKYAPKKPGTSRSW